MKYRVEWTSPAEQMLAAIWIASTARKHLAAVTHELEQDLATRPLEIGESRTSSVHRVAFRPPLGVEFSVIEDDKKVVVQGVFATA